MSKLVFFFEKVLGHLIMVCEEEEEEEEDDNWENFDIVISCSEL